MKTDTLLVFGSYSSHMFPSVCSEAVEKLGTVALVKLFWCSLLLLQVNIYQKKDCEVFWITIHHHACTQALQAV